MLGGAVMTHSGRRGMHHCCRPTEPQNVAYYGGAILSGGEKAESGSLITVELNTSGQREVQYILPPRNTPASKAWTALANVIAFCKSLIFAATSVQRPWRFSLRITLKRNPRSFAIARSASTESLGMIELWSAPRFRIMRK